MSNNDDAAFRKNVIWILDRLESFVKDLRLQFADANGARDIFELDDDDLGAMDLTDFAAALGNGVRGFGDVNRDPGDAGDFGDSREQARQRRLEQLKKERAKYAEEVKAGGSAMFLAVGADAFRTMYIKCALAAGMDPAQAKTVSSVGTAGDAANAYFMLKEFKEAMEHLVKTIESRREFDQRTRDLIRESFRQSDRNQMEVERVDREIRTA